MHTYDGVTTPADWICWNCGSPRGQHAYYPAVMLEGVVKEPERLLCRPDEPTPFTRSQYDFVGMMRIRNESRWIAEVLEAALPLCRRIFVMDDHSDDETAAICARYPELTVLSSPFTAGFNEARDKNWLLDQIEAQCEAQWILCIDGDEVLEQAGSRIIREHVEMHPCHAYSLKIVFLWNDRQTMRTDWVYGDFWRPSLFQPFHADPNVPDSLKLLAETRFLTTPFGRQINGNEPNLHCSSVPQRFLHGHQRLPARLKHLGYLYREDRVRKLDRYTGLDWLNRAEDCYRHMTQGDWPRIEELPTVQRLLAAGHLRQPDVDFLLNTPPEMRLVHAGPLTLQPFAE